MIEDNVQLIDLESELRRSFISYAMAVIIDRALPDVRDGLKPVHRRLLYSMHEQGNTPDKAYKKSVRAVGDVLGKYHPHGDTAVYDTMVRLAQDFTMRYPLVDGQGNFGSVDGDEAAAMRYTEARLSKISMEMLTDIEKDTVDFYPNFDESTTQPAVLPSHYPNLLVNGSSGIAVGMATNIPPHNMGEVIDGFVYLVDHPDCSVEELMQFIKGPDFPTGAMILGTSGIHAAYRTGRGRVIMRAKTEIEQMPNNKSRIIVTEIPYLVNKAKLVKTIAELVQEKRLEGISDLREESDRSGMRIVIELKQNVNANIVLNTLYKHTQLQDTFGVIMLVLVNGEPKVLNLKEILCCYLEHQKDVVVRRTRFDLERALARAHILEGLLKAIDNIDEIVDLIKSSASTAAAKEGLMTRFGMSERQAQAVLDLRLARLTALERDRLMEEYNELERQIAHFRDVLANEWMVLDIIKQEISVIRAKYADPRRTQITALEGEIDIADLIEEENIIVTRTHLGYIKRTSLDTYRQQKRGGKGVMGHTTRDEDFVEDVFTATTHSDLLFFTNRGRVFRLKGYQLPEAGRAAKGTAIVNLLQLDGEEKISAALHADLDGEGYLVLATRFGLIKKTAFTEFRNLRAAGLIAIALRPGDELIGAGVCVGAGRQALLGTRAGMCINFALDDMRDIGRAAQGVRSIDLAEGDAVVDMSIFDPAEGGSVLTITEEGYGKRTSTGEYRGQGRGGKGLKAMNITERTGLLVAQRVVDGAEDVIAIADDGTLIRFPVGDISVVGRVSQGVRVMRVADGSKLVAVAAVPAEESDEAEEQTEQNAPAGDDAAQSADASAESEE